MDFKKILRDGLMLPGATVPFRWLTRNSVVVFMLHRFQDVERDISGHRPFVLKHALEYMRRHKYAFVSLSELFQRLAGDGSPLRHPVAFTLDDGYADQATVACPLFAAFDCPVTTFVTTGFLDGDLWLWWDRIEYIFRNSVRNELQFPQTDGAIEYRWTDKPSRNSVQANLIQRCKRMSTSERDTLISYLAEQAEVALPSRAPTEYAAMSWHELRMCESNGMSFAPHSVTHPILSRLDEQQSRWEIHHSWSRLQAEAQQPLPIFAYPNGRSEDFGPREVAFLKDAGFIGAVTSVRGYNSMLSLQAQPESPFTVKRIAYPDSLSEVIQYVSGIERFRQVLRRGVGKT